MYTVKWIVREFSGWWDGQQCEKARGSWKTRIKITDLWGALLEASESLAPGPWTALNQ